MGYPNPQIYMYVHTHNTTESSCIVMQKTLAPKNKNSTVYQYLTTTININLCMLLCTVHFMRRSPGNQNCIVFFISVIINTYILYMFMYDHECKKNNHQKLEH